MCRVIVAQPNTARSNGVLISKPTTGSCVLVRGVPSTRASAKFEVGTFSARRGPAFGKGLSYLRGAEVRG